MLMHYIVVSFFLYTFSHARFFDTFMHEYYAVVHSLYVVHHVFSSGGNTALGLLSFLFFITFMRFAAYEVGWEGVTLTCTCTHSWHKS